MNILSFDIEEPWHTIPRRSDYEAACRPTNLAQFFDELEELIDPAKVTPIFFWVGTVADRHKSLVRDLLERGFLIGSHGRDHDDLARLPGDQLTAYLSHSRKHLQDITGTEIPSFRAPVFSLGNLPDYWDSLEAAGFQYDFSICDAPRIAGGGHGTGIRCPTHIEGTSIFEFPMSYNEILGKKIYATGGGYFRIAPHSVIERLQDRLDYNMYYLHPVDFVRPSFVRRDPRSLQQRIRQNLAWGSTRTKLANVVDNFEWHTGKEHEWAAYYE